MKGSVSEEYNISKFFLDFVTNVTWTTQATSIFYNNITNCAVLIAKIYIYMMDTRYIRYVWSRKKARYCLKIVNWSRKKCKIVWKLWIRIHRRKSSLLINIDGKEYSVSTSPSLSHLLPFSTSYLPHLLPSPPPTFPTSYLPHPFPSCILNLVLKVK